MALTPERIAELERLKEMMRQPAADAQRKAQAIFNAEKNAGQPVRLPTDKAQGGLAHMAKGGLTWNSPDWKPHPENDLLQPIGASKMVGDEKLLSQDNDYSHGLSEFPSSKRSYRYLYHGEDKNPIGSMQIQTSGPRSKKAVIQNLYVAEANRRQGIASKLLDRARQDFDVKHSNDLTTAGRAFAKAKKANGGTMSQDAMQLAIMPKVQQYAQPVTHAHHLEIEERPL
jgi:ribosomal protein S18 acetylase RimI-like enzyme